MGIVAASITDNRGYTPIHISRTEYLPYLGFGWGFRKGAPFLPRISIMMQHLIEAGMIEYWVEDVIATHMRRTREDTEDGEEETGNFDDIFEVPEGNVSLGFNHLQGAFYLLLLGCGLAFLTWLGEKASSCTT
ncbi:uncharacterized protein [Panulirus ornatus]|uniref:uncharacterized protein n=1 Tax=Panulirus ornatus TaxID=150431 RepID=UPI003A88062E